MSMTLVSTVTVGSGGVSGITFSSIPSSFTDLYVVTSTRDTFNNGQTWVNVGLTFNGVGTGYTSRTLYGDGSSAASLSESSITFRHEGAGQTANTFSSTQFYIPNYAGSTNKSLSIDAVTENNNTTSWQGITAALFSNTAAITSMTFTPNTLFAQFSTAYLYGITRGSGGATVS
jgi:hypothetical protein